MPPVLRLLFVLIVSSTLFIGIVDIFFNVESNGCEMTYMYETPQFIKVPLSSKLASKFPKYNLYVYGEGYYAESLRSFNLHGVPVLFIPGNAGSYKQVRSLATVAFRKAENLPFLFNYFTVDLNEEFSALVGGSLQEQTEFVGFCVKKILRMYKTANSPPTTIVLIGHSMGGILARALFTLPDFDSSSVHTIITLATPHQQPVITFDSYLSSFYQKVNDYWIKNSHTTLASVTMLSTGGGERDYQVPVWSTALDNIVLNGLAISTTTTSIPNVWVSTDHLCAVWCRQVVLTINQALFDMIDRNTKQITNKADFRFKVFNTYVHNHPGKIGPMRSWKQTIDIDAKAPWILKEDTTVRFNQQKVSKIKYVVMPVTNKDLDQFIAVSNVHSDSWICGCNIPEGKKRCETCTNLAQKGHALLPRNSNKKYVLYEVSELTQFSHIVLVIAPNNPPISVSAEFYSSNERHLLSPLPTWFTLPFTFSRNTMYYRMHFQNKKNILMAYTIQLNPYNCKAATNDEEAGSIMSLKFSWTSQSTYKFIKKNEAGNLSLKLLVPIPEYLSQADASLHLFLNPDCNYGLKIDWAVIETLGQFMRHYCTLLPAYCVVHLMLALNLLLNSRRRNQQMTIMDAVWAQKTDWVGVLPSWYIMECIFSHEALAPYFDWLPSYDSNLLRHRGIWGKIHPPLLAAVSFAITYLHVAFVALFFRVSRLVCSFMISERHTFYILCRLLLVVVTIFSLFIAKTLCGSISIVFTCIICFLKVIHVAEETNKSTHSNRYLNYSLYLFIWLIWQWMMALNTPSLLAWQLQLPMKSQLSPDPSQIAGFITPICIAFLATSNNLIDRINENVASPVFYLCAIATLLYGTVHLYRINMSLFVLVALLSFFTLRPQKDTK